MATSGPDMSGKGRRRWIKLAWAASALLVLLPFFGLWMMPADIVVASNEMARNHQGRAASNDARTNESAGAD